MKNIVITIGREYGSGGRYIGEQVAKKLNIPFYDKELLRKTYEKNGGKYSNLEEYDEKKKSDLMKMFSLIDMNNYDDTFTFEQYQHLIGETIKEIASSESCVILGRNSNNILKEKSNIINIFIYSNDIEFKIARKMQLENATYEQISKKMTTVDKQRKKYYEAVNKNTIWGSKKDYDYLIDSSVLGIDNTIELIVDIYNKFATKEEITE